MFSQARRGCSHDILIRGQILPGEKKIMNGSGRKCHTLKKKRTSPHREMLHSLVVAAYLCFQLEHVGPALSWTNTLTPCTCGGPKRTKTTLTRQLCPAKLRYKAAVRRSDYRFVFTAEPHIQSKSQDVDGKRIQLTAKLPQGHYKKVRSYADAAFWFGLL